MRASRGGQWWQKDLLLAAKASRLDCHLLSLLTLTPKVITLLGISASSPMMFVLTFWVGQSARTWLWVSSVHNTPVGAFCVPSCMYRCMRV